MTTRCVYCHEPVHPDVFKEPSFVCAEEVAEVEQPDGTKVAKRTGKHTHVPGQRGGTVVSKAYLDVARRHPERVHTVALAGFTFAGKTALLLSLGGLLDYPDQNSAIFNAFPPESKFARRPCGLFSFEGGEPEDRRGPTEAMWLDGVLPPRTSSITKATREPVLIRTKNQVLWHDATQEIILVFDDMAGEAISRPDMVNSENYPHFASVADAIYIVPANNLNLATLPEFVARFELARREGVNIDLRKANLIFVISKIDQLKYGTDAERDLLHRIVQGPYHLPKDKKVAELRAYVDDMLRVHGEIEDWLLTHKPEVFNFFSLFGSVRFCGISSFGFEPMRAPTLSEYEYTLPFRPEPIRAVDPLFWLLKENGLMPF